MRVLLSLKSKEELFNCLIKVHNCNSLGRLSQKLNIPETTIQNWRYNSQRYIPEKIIPSSIKMNLEILQKREDNWGQVIGGKKTYEIILKKYGEEEMQRRRSAGGIKLIYNLRKSFKNFSMDLKNKKFLEFYGALLGDGWLSKLAINHGTKTLCLVGISGHLLLDKEYHCYLSKIYQEIFNRSGYIKERPKYNSREILMGHQALLEFLNKKLTFPIGKKKNLKISEEVMKLDFDYTRFVLRGIFDTDGSFYLDKTPVGRPYPVISITMRAPILINQIKSILLGEGFKPIVYKNQEELKLKGSIQLRKWMESIGSSNPKHLNKINALVAQPG